MCTDPKATSPLDEAKKQLVEGAALWANFRKKPVLLFRSGSMSDRTADCLQEALHTKGFKPEDAEKADDVDVLIESPGGDPHATFLMACLIRRYVRKVTAVIPSWAKSGATLLAISMDEIVVSEIGQMGPLDTQTMKRNDRHWPRTVSALEIVRAMEKSQRSALGLWRMAAHVLLYGEKLDVHGAYQLASEFVGHVASRHFSPLQLDHYGESVRLLDITKNYAKTLMVRYRGASADDAENIATKLVEGYASHGCVVDALELIGMNIDGARYASADEQRILDLIRPRLAALNDLDGEGDPEKTVELVRVVMPALDPPAVKPVRSGMKADSLELQNGNGSNRSNENDVASGPTVRAGKQR